MMKRTKLMLTIAGGAIGLALANPAAAMFQRDPAYEQARANDYVVDFDHPELGAISIPGFPIQFSANSAGTVSSAPALGGHTVQVLKEYGYSDQDIDRLRDEGAIN